MTTMAVATRSAGIHNTSHSRKTLLALRHTDPLCANSPMVVRSFDRPPLLVHPSVCDACAIGSSGSLTQAHCGSVWLSITF